MKMAISAGKVRIGVLMAVDLLCIYCVWGITVLGYWLSGFGSYEPVFYLKLWPIGVLFCAINAMFRLYHGSILHPSAPLPPVEELRRLVGSSLITHLGVIGFLAFAFKTTQDYSRLVIFVSGVLTAMFSQPCRDLARILMKKMNIGQIPVLLAGSGEVAERIAEILMRDAYTGFRIIGTCDTEADQVAGLPRLGGLHRLVKEARSRDIRILIACQGERLFRAQLSTFTKWFWHVEYIPTAEIFPVYGSRTVQFDGLGGVEMVNQGIMQNLKYEKLVFDTSLALLAFVLLLPFFIIIPVLIKLTSKGPVFFRQKRLGRGGRHIRVWKFRSMYADAEERINRLCHENPAVAAEWSEKHKLSSDPRVTPLGRFLRKTSIDEFPQLFNVFVGDMALVGPRPIVDDEVNCYARAYPIMSSVKPGITGLWQISGRSETNYQRRVALDTQYVLNWSPWLDIWILIRTILAVVTMKGAC